MQPDRDILRQSNPGEAPWEIVRYERIDSTNLELLRLAEAGAPVGTVVVAATQSAGRGRLGRNWSDLPGRCLLMSVLLEPPEEAPGLLTAAMALAAAEAIDQCAPTEPRIKWPNDVLVAGRKVGGVLAEGPAGGPVAVGLGVNVNGSRAELPAELRDRAGFVSEEPGHDVLVGELEAAVLLRLDRIRAELVAGDGEALLERIARYDSLSGREITVATGADSLRGIARGWLPDGRLLLRLEDGREVPLDAGEVTVES